MGPAEEIQGREAGGLCCVTKEGRESSRGGEELTTNNRMEMLAAISALEALTRSCDVVLTTDSRYLRDGITHWIANWKKRGWKTAKRKPVKNEDLWRRLDVAVSKHNVDWKWIKGHSGHLENERVDTLANQAIDEMLVK